MIFLKARGEKLLLSIHAQPGASRTKIVGAHGDSLKVAVKAPPVDGEANEAISDFLAEVLGLGRRNIDLISGATNRKKVFLLSGIDLARAEACLREHL